MNGPFVESLESRQLLSISIAPAADATPTLTPTTRPAPVTASTTPTLEGTTFNAIDNQSFRVVIGTIRRLKSLPSGYTLYGQINWGDGTLTSQAQFVRPSDGTIDVIGEHTYANVGAYAIKVVVTAEPPPWSEAPVRLVGTFGSKANVIAANGGVTLEETAGVAFSEKVGYFRSTVDPSIMNATIDWGDGTESQGKIVSLPTAGLVPTYAVMDNHTYATTDSHLVHVTVYSFTPPPAQPSPTATPPIYLVAQFDSVIDVLPPDGSTATTS